MIAPVDGAIQCLNIGVLGSGLSYWRRKGLGSFSHFSLEKLNTQDSLRLRSLLSLSSYPLNGKQERKKKEMRWKAAYQLSVKVKGCSNLETLLRKCLFYTVPNIVCGMPFVSKQFSNSCFRVTTKTSISICSTEIEKLFSRAILRLRPQTTFGRGFLFIENRKYIQ